MRRALKLLNLLPSAVAAGALFALMLVTFSDVMLRSIWNAPIQAGADLTRVLMAVMVFSVLPVLSARGGHIAVDLLDGPFQRIGLARLSEVQTALTCGAMLLWPTQRVWVLADRSRSYGDVMEYLGMPLHYLGWFIAVMTGLTALVLVLRGIAGAIAPSVLETLK